MSRYYVFEIPNSITENLEPFKFEDEQKPEQLVDEPTESESSDSESDSGSGAESQRKLKLSKKSTFSSAVTKYIDEDDEISMEAWQYANRAHITGTPYVYFTNPSTIANGIPDGKVLSIYKAWFDTQGLIDAPTEQVQTLPPSGKSCILMVNSGNFAGLIVEHRRHHHKTNISNPFANIIVVESKTFHRYTTRRKQGGAQSASDAAHGKANSAGSTIRRANERALQEEIRELLASWAPQLENCHRIFVRAPGRANRQLIMGYPDAPVGKNDNRVAPIPFATGKPTLNECKNAWIQLTQAHITDAPQPPPPAQQLKSTLASPGRSKQSSPAPTALAKAPEPEITKEEQVSGLIVDLIKRSKLPALKTLIAKDADNNWDYPLQPASKFFAYPTPLLYAAHFDKHNVVSQLLKWGASPLVKNEQGQTLGDIAASHKRTKEALQVTRHALGESAWNWKEAKVGPPTTREHLLQRDLKDKLRTQRENERLEAEQDKKEKEQRMERLIKKNGSGRLVGGLYEASRGLSEDDLKQVERERRARAAEARLSGSGGANGSAGSCS